MTRIPAGWPGDTPGCAPTPWAVPGFPAVRPLAASGDRAFAGAVAGRNAGPAAGLAGAGIATIVAARPKLFAAPGAGSCPRTADPRAAAGCGTGGGGLWTGAPLLIPV